MKAFKQKIKYNLTLNVENIKTRENDQNSKSPCNPVTTSTNITEDLLQKGHCPRPVIYTVKTKQREKHTKISAVKKSIIIKTEINP